MHFITFILTLTALATGQLNDTQMYKLKTIVKGGAEGKEAFNNLYLQGYHTGAGLNDATLTPNRSGGINGYLLKTNISSSEGGYVYNQEFNLGTSFPWGLVMVPYETFYAQWQPVEVNAGASGNGFTVSGFFINETGLQWTSSPSAIGTSSDSFGGWLVCDWWHGTLQLFFRLPSYGTKSTPSSCADVELVPEYVVAAPGSP